MPSVSYTEIVDLRPYQHTNVSEIFRLWREHRRLLFVLATAGGKTVVAARVIQQLSFSGSRVLVMAHRRELIDQVYETLIADGVDESTLGVVMGDDPRDNPVAAVVVASVQTLRLRAKPEVDVVIVDEAHHAVSEGYQDILSWYPSAKILGLTATPNRLDGKPLNDAFDVLYEGAKPSELLAGGWISRPRIFTKPSDELPDLEGIRTVRGDYDPTELAKRVNRRHLLGDVVEHWKRLAQNRRSVLFAVNVQHATDLARAFLDAGVAAEVLTGDTPKSDRKAMIGRGGRLDLGHTSVVCTCMVTSEGWDLPSVKCAILVRPTKSTVLYLQQSGRIFRPYVETRGRYKGIEIPPLILDHAGNALIHGLPHSDRSWSLTGRLKNAGGVAPVKRCECGAVIPTTAKICEECGLVLYHQVPDVVDGKLEEMAAARREVIRVEYEHNLEFARARNFKDPASWAKKVIEASYGQTS